MGNKAWIRCVKHYQCPSKHSGASKKDSDLILQRLVSFVECASLDKTVKPGDVVNARFKYREWPDPEGFSRPTAEESLWEYECNALVYGCMEREETLVHWLLKQKGLDVMTVTREKGNTALTGAAFWYGWKEICAKILDRLREQCWEEAENEERERSHEPKENGGPEDLKIRPTTEEVAERKRLAHINTRNRPVGSTALYVTSYTSQSCPPTVQLLLKAGADHSIPTIDLPARRIQGETFDAIPAKTCLQAAADKHVFSKTSEAKKRDREVVRLLLEHGADRNMRYEYKHSPIDIARKAERDDIVSLLEKVQRTGVVPPFTGYRESRGSGRDRGRRTDEDEDDDESNERPPSPPDGISREYSNMDNTPTANFPRNGNTNANGRGIVVGRPIGQRKNQKEKKPAHKGPRNDNTRTNGNNVAAAMGRLALQGGTETRTMDSRDADDCSGGWTAGTRNPKSKSMQGITTDSTANTASENDTSTRGRGKKKRSKNRGRGNKNARHNDVDRDGGGEGSVQA